MGTNYYLETKSPCKKCGRGYEPYHIGKSSGGWCFSLHVYPDNDINTLEDVKKLWEGGVIVDEYGANISKEEMLSIITERSARCEKKYKVDAWCRSWADFHRMNHSEFGPNGLIRAKIDGEHCIGHGTGTYDFITGEFS